MTKNAKFSGYCFYMNTNIERDFQICIRVLSRRREIFKSALVSVPSRGDSSFQRSRDTKKAGSDKKGESNPSPHCVRK